MILELLGLRLLPPCFVAAVRVGLALRVDRARFGKGGAKAASRLGELVEQVHRTHGENSGGERGAEGEHGETRARS